MSIYGFFFQKSGGKLAGGYVELGEEQEPVKKKRKIVSRAVRPTLGSQFKAADTSSVKQVISEAPEGHFSHSLDGIGLWMDYIF